MKATAKEIYENHSEVKGTTAWKAVQGNWYWWGCKIELIIQSYADTYVIFWADDEAYGNARIPADSILYLRDKQI